jgi:hypothetical protein
MNNFNDDLEKGIYRRNKYNIEESHVINIKPNYLSFKKWKNMLVSGLIISDECPVNSKSYHESCDKSCNESCDKSCNECTIS